MAAKKKKDKRNRPEDTEEEVLERQEEKEEPEHEEASESSGSKEASESGNGGNKPSSDDSDSGNGEEPDYKELYEAQAEKYARLMAEFENFKRRTAREYESMVQSASERLMKELVEVREGFERAISQENKDGDFEKFFEGIQMLFNRFDKILGDNGLETFGEPGEKFDPDLHDAMMNTPHPEIEEGRIASIYERGYKLNGKVMKHAKVLISSGKPENQEQGGDKDESE